MPRQPNQLRLSNFRSVKRLRARTQCAGVTARRIREVNARGVPKAVLLHDRIEVLLRLLHFHARRHERLTCVVADRRRHGEVAREVLFRRSERHARLLHRHHGLVYERPLAVAVQQALYRLESP